MLQVLLCCSLLVLSTLAVAPAHYPPKEEAPKPYSYQYGVADEVSKANFQSSESQDSNVSHNKLMLPINLSASIPQGNVKGQYVIALPDGRIQTTTYTADPLAGFVAKVSYQGEPVYPDPSTYTVTATV